KLIEDHPKNLSPKIAENILMFLVGFIEKSNFTGNISLQKQASVRIQHFVALFLSKPYLEALKVAAPTWFNRAILAIVLFYYRYPPDPLNPTNDIFDNVINALNQLDSSSIEIDIEK